MKFLLLKSIIKNGILIFLGSLTLCCCNACGKSNDDIDSEPDPTDPPIAVATFTNPIRNSGADPWVFKDGNEYFVTFTTGGNITLLRTEKMSDVKSAVSKVVWYPPSTGLNSKEIWAPEIHKINNVWYVYYAASDGDNLNHKMWVLENTSSDPFEGTWEDKGELILPDNKWAIDGSPLELNGKYYFAWSGWEGDSNVSQNIYMAEMESPVKVIGERTLLLKPTDFWEKNNTTPEVTEGPQFLKKNDKVFLFYSAGGCWTDQYSIGMMWMDSSSNPMDSNSWQKSENNPLFVSNTSGSTFGPGHNSFFKSKDGSEDWILYHANPLSGQGCGGNRSMRMQQISWDNDDFPVLGIPEPTGKKLNKPEGE